MRRIRGHGEASVASMTLFHGSAICDVDAEGNVMVPEFLAAALPADTTELVIARHDAEACLVGYGRERLAELRALAERRRLAEEDRGEDGRGHHRRMRRTFGLSDRMPAATTASASRRRCAISAGSSGWPCSSAPATASRYGTPSSRWKATTRCSANLPHSACGRGATITNPREHQAHDIALFDRRPFGGNHASPQPGAGFQPLPSLRLRPDPHRPWRVDAGAQGDARGVARAGAVRGCAFGVQALDAIRRTPRNGRFEPHRDPRGRPLEGVTAMFGILANLGKLVSGDIPEDVERAPERRKPIRLPGSVH